MLLISFVTILSYMGLAEFGVATSADAEILHELTYPPAHNHMGDLLPVPYDQLAVGMYSTREAQAEDGDAANVLAAFNQEVDTTIVPTIDGNSTQTAEAWIVDLLSREDHLAVSSLNFTPVPADAPALKNVIHEFETLLEESDHELYNAWGAVVITQNQNNLKRIDVVIVWDEVLIESGEPVLDESGNVIPVLDDSGQPVRRLNRTHLFIHQDGAYFAN
jgi:hypothetical protein